MVHTVAVNAHVVHHVDVDDTLFLVKIVCHSLCGSRHALKESLLVVDILCPKFQHIELFHSPCRVDVSLAVLAGTSDREVFQRSAVAAHGVTFEVAEGNHKVVIGHVTAHDVILDVLLVLYGDADLVVLVHNIYWEILGKAVPLDDLPVVLGGVAVVFLVQGAAGVGGVALHYGAVHLEDQILDKLWFQIVGVAPLAGTHLNGHTSLGWDAQCLVNPHERLRGDFSGQIDCRLFGFLRLNGFCFLLEANHQQGGCHRNCYK